MSYKIICHREAQERDDHKYVARVLTNKGSGKKKNTYRYFYDKDEYQAYLKSKKDVEEDKKSKKETSKSTTTTKKKSINLTKVIDKLDNILTAKLTTSDNAKGKKNVNKLFGNSKNTSTKNTAKGKKKVDTALNNIGDKKISGISDTLKNMTKSISKAVKKVTDTITRNKDEKTKEKKTKEKIEFPDLKRKTKECTKEEDQAAVNPNYDSDREDSITNNYYTDPDVTYEDTEVATDMYVTENYEYNCSYCTATYDLRQRGYDVEAMPINMINDDYPTMEEITSWYKDVELVKGSDLMAVTDDHFIVSELSDDDIESFVNSLEENEEGSYGHLLLWWTGGGGHDVIWSIENGEAVIRDCQTNATYEPEEYLSRCCNADYFRSDNLELNDEIQRVVRNRS